LRQKDFLHRGPIREVGLAILIGTPLLTAHADPVTVATHAFDPSAPDVNKYNLDMSQDNISAGNFMYCRWGLLSDFGSPNQGQLALHFDSLTPSPFSQDNKSLFILSSTNATDQFQLSSFGSLWPLPSASSWTSGQLSLPAPQNATTYFLFREYNFSPVLLEFQGAALDTNATKLVIMIHGWNPNQNSDDYQQDTFFNNLGTAIHNQISGTDWKLVGYHWEADADTGPVLAADLYNFGAVNGAESAEASYQHGLHLGQVLLNNYPQLNKVHFVSHSSGAWCARTAARYLMQRNSAITVEVTLLDPFVPDDVPWDIFEPIDPPSTSLTDDRINDLLNFGNSAYMLENYYSDDGLWVAGTQSTFWGGGGVGWNSAINEQVGTSVGNGDISTTGYGTHSGPIGFYTDTVLSTLPPPAISPPGLSMFGSDLQKLGWWRSMFLNELLIDQQPASITDATQGQPVSFTAHATIRREQRGYPASGLTLSYNWQKNTTPTLLPGRPLTGRARCQHTRSLPRWRQTPASTASSPTTAPGRRPARYSPSVSARAARRRLRCNLPEPP
jgi:hypothetical protein